MNRLSILSLALLAGCSCNQDYSFPKYVDLSSPEPENFGAWLSMDVAPDGQRITMSYYDGDAGAVGFAVGVPDGDTINWVHERVAGYAGSDGIDPGDMGHYGSQKVAADGTVWVAFKDVNNGGLWVAHRTAPNVWESELVDAGSGMGYWASLDIGADGPIIAHHDGNDGTLRVCRQDGEAGWACAVAHTGEDSIVPGDTGLPVVSEANVGQYARLYINPEGVEHIAFYDAAFGSLNLLEGKDGSYVHTVIDDVGDVGQWPAIHASGDDLYISYHDVGDQDLMLAKRESGQWSTERIDDGDYVGADSEIFEMDGDLAVVYFDGFNNDMKLATRSGGAWTTSTLAGADAAVGFHNEVVKVHDRLWTASYDYTNDALYAAEVAAPAAR